MAITLVSYYFEITFFFFFLFFLTYFKGGETIPNFNVEEFNKRLDEMDDNFQKKIGMKISPYFLF